MTYLFTIMYSTTHNYGNPQIHKAGIPASELQAELDDAADSHLWGCQVWIEAEAYPA